MKKVKVKDFFKRLSKEVPYTKFEWLSLVEADHANRIFAKGYLHGEGFYTEEKGHAQDHYGAMRHISGVSSSEWVHKLSIRKTLKGPILELETFI